MPFWKSSGSSHSLNTDSALDYPRSNSRQDQYPPPSPSDTPFRPFSQQESVSGLVTPSQQSLGPPVNVQSPPSAYSPPPIGGTPYDQSSLGHEPSQSSRHQQVARKSIKSKLLAAAAASREEASEQKAQHKGLFGRRKSVRREAYPTFKQESSLYEQNSAQWKPEHNQAPTLAAPSDRFEPLSPDFTLDQAETEHQTQHTFPYPDQSPNFDERTPKVHTSQFQPQQEQAVEQTHFFEPTPSAAGSAHSPNRPSFESSQRPPSRPDLDQSRPSSRASYDRYPAQSTAPYRPPPGQISHEARLQGVVQESTNALAYRPYQKQQQQQPLQQYHKAMPPPSDPHKSGTPTSTSSGGLQPPTGPHDPGSQSVSGLTHSHSMDSSPLGGKNQSIGREDLSQRAVPHARVPSDLTESDIQQILEAHRKDATELNELKKKYNNVKRQFFAQKDQVDTLQNTLAHQRLSASRTSLDDGEYVKRMTRLDGLASQLAYNIRKEWARLPDWLESSCNKDALQMGKQEMIAVGRAFMSRWLVDEVFDKYFHPDLHPQFSIELKDIQKNMRNYAPHFQNSDEENEALTAKINNWRLSTVDGMKPLLASDQAASNRQALTEALGEQMLQDFARHMKDPPSGDFTAGVPMIIELAVSVLANLPLESRDVHIGYFNPGTPIFEEVMKVETGIPVLPGSAPPPEESEQGTLSETAPANAGPDKSGPDSLKVDESSRKSFLGGLMGNSKKGQKGATSPSQQPTSIQPTPVQSPTLKEEEQIPRVRMCVFPELQVRGKMSLMKAPVYRM